MRGIHDHLRGTEDNGAQCYAPVSHGVHKTYLAVCVAMGEVRINEQRITPGFIAQLVKLHHF